MGNIDSHRSAAKPGTFRWEVPGSPISIFLSLDVVDRLLQDVMRGFGAVPKRGAEVGGILLGRITEGPEATVEVDDYELVPIEYKRGPSFLLSDHDIQVFRDTFKRLAQSADGAPVPVGLFRSNTRDSAGLMQEDLSLADVYFPEPSRVFLFIKPYATKVSIAGFYFRDGGSFQSGPPLGEFPFRRKDLAGDSDDEPLAAATGDRRARLRSDRPDPISASDVDSRAGRTALSHPDVAPTRDRTGIAADYVRLSRAKTWVWLPFSLGFLLLGALLGFQTALTLHPATAAAQQALALSLSITRDGDNLNVQWDRQSSAIKAARHGVLVIEDGKFSKTVDLDPSQLQTGSVIYRHSTKDVKFRLEAQIRDHTLVSENLEWVE